MKLLLGVAKAAVAFVWLVLLFNLISPFQGQISTALYLMTAFLFVMHGIQLQVFVKAFGNQVQLSRQEKIAIFAFGVFALLELKQKYLSQNK